MAANVFAYAGFVGLTAVTTLLAGSMLDADTWAGLPAATTTLGTAVAATPLALRSKRKGRRRGVRGGYLVGIVGAGLAFASGQLAMFWLFAVAMALAGVGQASTLQNRYAAADLADEDRRARDISLVVWVGTVGAVVGPVLARSANRAGIGMGLREWVAPMALGVIGFAAGWTIIEARLRPDPLEVAGGVDPTAKAQNPLLGLREAWRVVFGNNLARLSITAMVVSQMAMVGVMVMTPLHMRDHGHAEMSLLVVAVHVFGMFGFAPLIGAWADRRGRITALRVGAAVLGVGTVVTVVGGYSPPLMFIGLFLLGVGWNFAFVAGSALLTECLPANYRLGAQGLSDVMMSAMAALAAFGSGFIKEAAGFHWLANIATVAAAGTLIYALATDRSREPVVVRSS